MTRSKTRFAAIAAILLVGLSANRAWADPTTTSVSLDSRLAAGLSGTGNIHVTSASGNYLYWASVNVPFFGTQFASFNIGLSANNQNVGLNMSPISPDVSLSHSTSMSFTYDNNVANGDTFVTPTINSLSGTLLDTAHAVPFTINANNPLNITGSLPISIAGISLGSVSVTVPVNLTVNGQITGISFTSTGASTADSVYGVPGNVNVTLQGTVSGTIPYITVLGINIPVNIGLGTLGSIGPLTESVATTVPGILVQTDASGGSGPYPANLGLQLLAGTAGSFSLPLTLPISTTFTGPPPSDHNSELTSLTIAPGSEVDANLTVTNPGYIFNGTIPNGLISVPEPSSLVLGSAALLGLVGLVARRKSTRRVIGL